MPPTIKKIAINNVNLNGRVLGLIDDHEADQRVQHADQQVNEHAAPPADPERMDDFGDAARRASENRTARSPSR